ncbi:glycosyltransferase [Gelatiniphilus marinus]|uniref:Glycosyltransferase n=1 Tax=Gelatiniphilus marinus TaxID=1759464 RepID=A0ABW5JQY5_9FLAO
MKTIILIMPYGSVGGMERLALTFYNHYQLKGYRVKAIKLIKLKSDIINFNNDEYYLSDKDFSELNPIKRILFYLLAPFKIRKIIKKEQATDSISFGDMANIFSALTFTKENKISSIHALKSVELNDKNSFNTLIKFSYKKLYGAFNKVVCISNDIKRDLIENCGFKFPEKMEVIYNPHNAKRLVELSEEPIDNKQEIQLFFKKTILFIGRLSVQKSPWHLINAFNLLQEKGIDANLIFIGDGNSSITNHIKSLASNYGILDSIHFLGRKNNPFKYLQRANVLALSSHYEGTPNVIVESIAVGTPVVSSYCTDGIIELMSLNAHHVKNENLHVEAGIITPNLYKGNLGIPKTNHVLPEEQKFADALKYALQSPELKNNLLKNRNQLLSKFDVKIVSEKYLTPNK